MISISRSASVRDVRLIIDSTESYSVETITLIQGQVVA